MAGRRLTLMPPALHNSQPVIPLGGETAGGVRGAECDDLQKWQLKKKTE